MFARYQETGSIRPGVLGGGERKLATRESEPRKEWLFASPAFVAYTANKIWFTASVELALADTDGSGTIDREELKAAL